MAHIRTIQFTVVALSVCVIHCAVPQGIFRRGLQVEALREFILSQGASKNVTYQEWDKIWTINKKLIDPVCPRHTGIETENKVLVTLEGEPESTSRKWWKYSTAYAA